jgi:NAD(P)-dependent dehydrogenase (short-subunit alcohol dehydrogenase family)
LKIRFLEEYLQRFSLASLDFNPLHLSESYARRSAFGERVVYGMLGFLACLAKISVPQGKIASSVEIDFNGPQFLNIDYSVEVHQESPGHVSGALMDGSTPVMEFRLEFRDGAPELVDLPDTGVAPRQQARELEVSQLTPGLSFRGEYCPARTAYLELLRLLSIERSQWGDALLLTALCTSYLTGMELPGESAAYSGLRAQLLEAVPKLPLEFEIRLERYDRRFSLVHSDFGLLGAAGVSVRGRISAVVRPRRVEISSPCGCGEARLFEGKTAVVIGASRGLGAALALELAAQGCTVVGVYARSSQDAEAVCQASRDLPGRMIFEQGDASDPHWCAALKDRIRAEFGGLDLLVCSAAPAPQPLRVEAASYDRILAYVQKAFALVAAPLSSFLELVSSSSGRVLLISSSFVEKPSRLWPQYIAVKSAAEGLVRSAAAGQSKVTFWIARPDKILTDMTNTPVGRLNAEEPAVVAHRILQQVGADAAPGTVRSVLFR